MLCGYERLIPRWIRAEKHIPVRRAAAGRAGSELHRGPDERRARNHANTGAELGENKGRGSHRGAATTE